ncbi:helix-turn-helix domain-containing protein [Massilia pseudoviolaceinigra]|uniref:helix-turn-helix domain-containing protein n=1 Tax=Massilia pseudoviolaceinigra TaxID=3057165 RepID=UPI00279652C0|nr:helix-turn-helix domain-containing protein [Massilia sp. CCM 9206]MDQ1919940.1 helix-turn-helix domain-containing protein [Massilia sp. CCM 9206]
MRNAKPATAKPAKAANKPAKKSAGPERMQKADALAGTTIAVPARQVVNAPKTGATMKSAPTARARPHRSDAFEAIHSAAAALHSVGIIDKKTMREFDKSCFTPPSFTASDVLRIRNKENLSQEVLARYMGITKSTVVKWESAYNIPSPMAQRLLKVIDEQGINAIAGAPGRSTGRS